MREFSRERVTSTRSYEDRGDFRDNLVSIFVGNLNPIVDTECLWGIFKVFEVVRGLREDKSWENVAVPGRVKSLSWDIAQRDVSWVSKCAIGVMKSFSNVSKVAKERGKRTSHVNIPPQEMATSKTERQLTPSVDSFQNESWKWQKRKIPTKEGNKRIGKQYLSGGMLERDLIDMSAKGKSIILKKSRVKPLPICNPYSKLVIDKKMVAFRKDFSMDKDSSSFGDGDGDIYGGTFFNSHVKQLSVLSPIPRKVTRRSAESGEVEVNVNETTMEVEDTIGEESLRPLAMEMIQGAIQCKETAPKTTPKKRGRPCKSEKGVKPQEPVSYATDQTKPYEVANKKNLSLEVEIAKIIETGAKLGGYFKRDGEQGDINRRLVFRGRNFKIHRDVSGVWIGLHGGLVLNRGIGVKAVGSAGGLITLWNEELFKVNACISNQRCIIVVGLWLKFNKEVIFCNIYAPNLECERKTLWDFILVAQQSFPVPWCFGGDFNDVLDPSERRGGVCSQTSLHNFNSFVLHAKVTDLPLQGVSLLSCLIIMRSSLVPLLKTGATLFFEFFNGWLEENGLMDDVKRGWKECMASGHKGIVLRSKLKAVKGIIKKWHQKKDSSNRSFKPLTKRLAGIENSALLNGWTAALRQERERIIADMWKIIRIEERDWRQKSRVKWLLEGDKNTRYFHNVANARRRGNFVGDLVYNGAILSAPELVRNGALEYFQDKFKKVPWRRPKLVNLDLKVILVEDRKLLEVDFEEEEVWNALCSCNGNKAPGPDGFNINFIKANWDVIKEEFMSFLKELHVEMGLIKGVTIGNNEVQISHLQFADDTIIFLELNLEFVTVAKRILRCFELVSGLSVNFHKSYLIKIGRMDSLTEEAATIFKCNKVKLPLLYLEKRPPCGRWLSVKGTGWITVCCIGLGMLVVMSLTSLEQWVLYLRLAQLQQGMKAVIGRGNRARLLEDIKWDDFPLKVAFPRLFALSNNKGGVVSKFGSWWENKWRWEIGLRKPLFDWERDQWKGFLTALECVGVRQSILDTLAWTFNSNGLVSVRSFCAMLEGHLIEEREESGLLWKSICPF
ncbi:hypothetical protein Dsin_023914 [Dipteronia sinensis]|uniref:Reverse transcriptase domain-containing protein n=1 Tax=Dipteronia sinensis TaxID=43782 RepID=A0AAE0E1H8_9ROSI|nr:hypothetical protein Dsin_023914 [Dipteronia sinensis]